MLTSRFRSQLKTLRFLTKSAVVGLRALPMAPVAPQVARLSGERNRPRGTMGSGPGLAMK